MIWSYINLRTVSYAQIELEYLFFYHNEMIEWKIKYSFSLPLFSILTKRQSIFYSFQQTARSWSFSVWQPSTFFAGEFQLSESISLVNISLFLTQSVEMGPDPTRAYFWPAVNKRPTCLWPGYFPTRPEVPDQRAPVSHVHKKVCVPLECYLVVSQCAY